MSSWSTRQDRTRLLVSLRRAPQAFLEKEFDSLKPCSGVREWSFNTRRCAATAARDRQPGRTHRRQGGIENRLLQFGEMVSSQLAERRPDLGWISCRRHAARLARRHRHDRLELAFDFGRNSRTRGCSPRRSTSGSTPSSIRRWCAGQNAPCPLWRDPVAVRAIPQPCRAAICHDHIVAPTIAPVSQRSYVRARARRRPTCAHHSNEAWRPPHSGRRRRP